jgi:aminoglycoside 3-N-acetyltransferase
MVLHRLLNVLGKKGTLLMPTFTSITRHGSTHDDFTKIGCWCQGREIRHLPFIPELQPDREIGEISHRLCSWPGPRRSGHPAFSFAAVGQNSDQLVRKYSLIDPLQPLSIFLKQKPFVLTIGTDLDSAVAIHLAEKHQTPGKFVKERALTMASDGPVWVEVLALGCSRGFQKLSNHLAQKDVKQTTIGAAKALLYPMDKLVVTAQQLLEQDSTALRCGRPNCFSCQSRAL